MLDEIRAHAASAYPSEAIGILAGDSECDLVVAAVPLANSARHGNGRAIASPAEAQSALDRVRAAGWRQLGVYHSHPDGAAELSRPDLRAIRAESVEFVVTATRYGVGQVYGWLARPGAEPQPLRLHVVEDGDRTTTA